MSSDKKKSFKERFLISKNDDAKTLKNKVIVICAALVCVVAIVSFTLHTVEGMRSNAEYKKWSEIQSSLAEETTTSAETSEAEISTEKQVLPLGLEMLSENPEAIGWIKIENTNINYPVVLRKNKDDGNEYYLSHSFDGSSNRKGTIFADYRTTIDGFGQSDNIVLYGHNESDNSMFGDLDKYKNNSGSAWCDKALEFYKENPTVSFNTNYENATYKIFAVFVTMRTDEYDDIPLFSYQNYIDFSEDRYNDFVDNIEKRNKLVTDVDYEYGDKFLTLSTCSNEASDARLVIVARRVRDGESKDVDTSGASFNPAPVYEHNWSEIYKK